MDNMKEIWTAEDGEALKMYEEKEDSGTLTKEEDERYGELLSKWIRTHLVTFGDDVEE